jgi:predicted dehydrogenase
VLPDSGDVTHHPFQEEIDDFVACILAGREASPNLEDAARTTAVCLAADHSADHGGAPANPEDFLR